MESFKGFEEILLIITSYYAVCKISPATMELKNVLYITGTFCLLLFSSFKCKPTKIATSYYYFSDLNLTRTFHWTFTESAPDARHLIFLLLLLSAHIERFSVSRMRKCLLRKSSGMSLITLSD